MTCPPTSSTDTEEALQKQARAAAALTQAIKAEGKRLGFLAVGVTRPDALGNRQSELSRWISSGFSGHLDYMQAFFQRQARLLAGFPDLKSILVLAVPYASRSSQPPQPGSGRIARYAWGRDYHKVVEKRLKRLEAFLQEQAGGPARTLRCVDTSPVQERALAEMAGLGFIGKNTCLILPGSGSFVFLAALLTNIELVPDDPIRWDCGACTLCMEACPTQALSASRPYQMDASRCIAYLTIELKEAVEPALRSHVENWLFGCDICQEVCPYNRKTPDPWPEFQPEAGAGSSLPLQEILSCRTEEQFLGRFAGTPLTRAKRAGLLRNAAIAAGNQRNPGLTAPLAEALQNDPSALARQHAAWALGRIGTPEARQILSGATMVERDPQVLQEITAALST